jgi:peptidyl-prolyl cis-trans isomerase SurA
VRAFDLCDLREILIRAINFPLFLRRLRVAATAEQGRLMYTKMMRVACSVGFLLIAVSAFSQKTSEGIDKVLFSVDNQPVYASEFLYLYNKNNKGKPDQKSEPKIREYLDLVIAFKLKVAEAHQRGIDTTQAFIHEFTTYRDELKKPYVASQDDLGRLVKEAYERMKEEVKASHILVRLSPDATPNDTLAAWRRIVSIRNRAVGGEEFSTLAKEFSDDPSAKQNGGNLGYFTAMGMVYQFEDGAYKTKVGEISQPVRTRFGYHIIKVVDRRPASKVEVSHIFLSGNDDRTKNKAFEVYDQLKGGRSWDEVCKEYSEDTNTKDRGGKLPAIGVGDFPAVPEFEETALSMQNPGDISDPFKSQVGWHIIRFEKRLPLPPFADAEPALKRRVGRDERLQVSHAAQLTRRKAELNLAENATVRSALESKADTSLQKGRWKVTANNAEALFTVNNNSVTVGDFLKYVKAHQRASALAPAAYFKQLYDQFTEVHLSDAEDAKLQSTNAEYRNLVREYREGIMFFTIMEKEVWNKGSADTLGQRAYYESHKNKYAAGDRVFARMYSSPDKEFMKQVLEKTKMGDTLSTAEAKKFKSVTTFRAYGKGENKIVDMIPWAIGIHEAEADGMYYLVEIERLLPPGTRSFQEAKAGVISDYQEEIEKKWLEGLRAKHKVTVNKKSVKAVVQQLKK